MEITDTIRAIADLGILVIIAGIFLYDWLKNSDHVNRTLDQNTQLLQALSSTNKNISEALNLLRKSMDNQLALLKEHDARSTDLLESIKENKK